ncbi:MAG: hypothetical protein AAF645_28370 [Myxococcota bacterium]
MPRFSLRLTSFTRVADFRGSARLFATTLVLALSGALFACGSTAPEVAPPVTSRACFPNDGSVARSPDGRFALQTRTSSGRVTQTLCGVSDAGPTEVVLEQEAPSFSEVLGIYELPGASNASYVVAKIDGYDNGHSALVMHAFSLGEGGEVVPVCGFFPNALYGVSDHGSLLYLAVPSAPEGRTIELADDAQALVLSIGAPDRSTTLRFAKETAVSNAAPCIGPNTDVDLERFETVARLLEEGSEAAPWRPLAVSQGDTDSARIELFGDGRLRVGDIEARVEMTGASMFWMERQAAVAWVELDSARGQRAVLVTLPVNETEDPPNRYQLFLVEDQALRRVFDQVIGAYGVQPVRFPGDGSLRYNDDSWAACQREDTHEEEVELLEHIYQMTTNGMSEFGTEPTGEQFNCNQLAG